MTRTIRMKRLLSQSLLLLLPGLLILSALSPLFAQQELPTAHPEQVGVDSRRLVQLSQAIRKSRIDVRSLLIVRDGKLIFERYSAGVTREHNHSIYSVTKSVTSTLIGILVQQGRLPGVDGSIVDLLPDVPGVAKTTREAKRPVRLGDVLHMASGLRWDEHPVNTPLYRADDRLAVALRQPMENEPGTTFNYSNADAEMVGAVVHHLSGKNGLEFAKKYLFEPLGMKNYDWWYPDRAGRYPGGWSMRLRAIDMAKLGSLYLEGGKWGERRIVTKEWIAKATAPGPGKQYGYFWWLGLFDGRPSGGGFSANGWKGQYIIVDPRRRLVVTMTSVLPAGDENGIMLGMMNDYILPAVRSDAKPIEFTVEVAQALREEIELSARQRGEAGQPLIRQDIPRLR